MGVQLPSLCQRHWDMLKEKVNDAGLGKWVAQSGEMAVQQLADQVIRGGQLGNWDPLMSCWMLITGNAMELAGPAILGSSEHDNCVICFLNAQRNPDGSCPCKNPECPAKAPGSVEDFENWLDYAVNGQVEYAKHEGLI